MRARLFQSILLIGVLVSLSGCSGTKAPAQGSPEWLWAAARDAYKIGDIDKTKEHLEKIELRGSNPYIQRARAWRMVMDAGLGNAHLELAQAHEEGSKNAKVQKTAFLRQRNTHLAEARRHALHLVTAYDALVKEPLTQPIVLEFPFPQGTAQQVTEMDRVYKGLPVSEDQRITMNTKVVNRGAVRAVSAVLTTADDQAGAQNALKEGRAEVPAARFLAATAAALDKAGSIFDRKYLDDSEKLRLFRARALDACKRSLELKPDAPVEAEVKKLQADLDKALKTPPPRIRSVVR